MITFPIKKIGESRDVDWDSFPDNTQLFLQEYALKQWVNDQHADITRSGKNPFPGTEAELVEAVRANVADSLARLAAGDIPGARVARKVDPRVEAAKTLVATLEDAGLTLDDVVAMIAAKKTKKEKAA